MPDEFGKLRPRLKVLLSLHRAAETEEERATLEGLFDDVFLAAAWQVAQDLLENGWKPIRLTPGGRGARPYLRLVEKADDAA
ncbi:MAG: hypothetical protein JO127_05640 [Caulobacteraceae bacterium]|nr:hypothetical protein [Caulobacteraceae bacterium]